MMSRRRAAPARSGSIPVHVPPNCASPESFFLRRRNLAATAPFCYFTGRFRHLIISSARLPIPGAPLWRRPDIAGRELHEATMRIFSVWVFEFLKLIGRRPLYPLNAECPICQQMVRLHYNQAGRRHLFATRAPIRAHCMKAIATEPTTAPE